MSRCIYCKNYIRTMGFKAENAGGFICGDCYELCSYDIQKNLKTVTYEEIKKSIEKKETEIGRKNRLEFNNLPDNAKNKVRRNTRLALIITLLFIILVYAFITIEEIRTRQQNEVLPKASISIMDNKKTEVSFETSEFFCFKNNYCSSTA